MAASGKWTCYHLLVFILTFFSYAFFHATRKAFSNIKDTLRKEWTPYNATNPLEPANVWQSHYFFKSGDDAGLFLGAMDTTFLSTYAMGLFISGIIGDRYNLRKVLSLGMCLSAIMVFMFGTVSKWLNIHNIWYYGIFMALNGICQSAGWPSAVAIMGNWFGKSSRGLVFGIWSACASVGNIFGSLEAAAVLKYGYEYSMMLPSVILFAGGIIIFFCLTPSPTDIGLPLPVDEDSTEEERQPVFQDANSDQEQSTNPASNNPYLLPDTLFDSSSTRPKEPKKAIGFCTALFLPGVISFSLSYACLKLVNYSFFFWLPYYLSYGLKIDDTISDELSTFYDVGGIFGGAIAGLITDRMRSRLPVVATMLILSIGSLFLYYHTSADYTSNAAVMTLTGFMIGGPANLISSAISADLGRQSCLKGNSEALATVTGIVDGTGSVGAAIGQIMIPILTKSKHKETSNSWKYVFYFLMVMTFLSFVCIIIPPIVARIRKRRENQDGFLEPSPRTVNTATPDTWK